MVQWRDRGFVADSDDEDLGLESEESQVIGQNVGNLAFNEEAAWVEGDLLTKEEHADLKEREQGQDPDATPPIRESGVQSELTKEKEDNHDGVGHTDFRNIEDDSDIAVADNDSDDDLPPISAITKLGKISTLADEEDERRLPRESEIPLEAANEARIPRKDLPVSEDLDIFDSPSSPLSDARSDMSEVPNSRKTFVIPRTTYSEPPHEPLRSQSPHLDLLPQFPRPDPSDPGHDFRSITGRIFRRRAPIQLHPYILEQEQYKQSLRARGLRPVAIASSPHARDTESQEQESQFQQSNEAEDSQLRDIPSSSPMHQILRENTDVAQPPELPVDYDSDDLPDLSSLNNPLTFTAERRGAKRRKVLQTYSRGSVKHTYPQMPAVRVERTSARTDPASLNDVYAVPPSPTSLEAPDVHLSKRRKRPKKFVVPPGMTPGQRQLPTPDRSSQTPRAVAHIRQLLPQLSSESESDFDIRPMLPHPLPSLTNSDGAQTPQPTTISSDESGSSEAETAKTVSRRLRGVLPASWLRLDQQARPSERHTSVEQSPAKTQQRGVAQRVRKSQHDGHPTSTPALPAVLDISDNSESQSPDHTNVRDEPRESAYNLIQRQNSRVAGTLDIEEEDDIDFMLPTATRNRKSGGSRNRQSRLTDILGKAALGSTRLHGAGRASRALGSRKPPTSTKRRVPRLSIIDSTTLPEPGEQPDFLRIATRQARSANNKGRHSPTHKIVQMQDRRNDADVKDVLGDWKRGRVRPAERKTQPPGQRHSRRPLRERSNNQQRLPSPISTRCSTLKQLIGPSERNSGGSSSRRGIRQSRLSPEVLPARSAASESSRATTAASHSRRESELCDRPPGQLEEIHVTSRPAVNHRSALRSNLQTMNALSRAKQQQKQPVQNLVLDRFLEQDFSTFDQDVPEEPRQLLTPEASAVKRRARKRVPHRLDFEEADIDFATTSVPDTPASLNRTLQMSTPRSIEGIGPFGTYYTNDFDIKPLPKGTYFCPDTFIGNGDMARALKIRSRDLETPSHKTTRFDTSENVFRLGAWTEEVSGQLQEVVQAAIEQDRIRDSSAIDVRFHGREKVVRAYIDYVSTAVYFLDAIDRAACLRSMLAHFQQLLESMDLLSSDASSVVAGLRVLTFLTVLIGQAYLLSLDVVVGNNVRGEFEKLLRQVVPLTSRILFKDGLTQLWSLHRRASATSIIEQGISSARFEAETVVVVHHVLSLLNIAGLSFTDFTNIGLAQNGLWTTSKVSIFDRTWHDIFAILPLLYFDENGLVSRLDNAAGALSAVEAPKLVLENTLQLYQHHLLDLTRPINPYVRATLARCFVLIRTWGWRKCDAVLSTMFDFFARNDFALLRNEDGANSPRFLRSLNEHGLPRLEPGDRSFDIFLKALYVGLHNMRQELPDKKIRNIAWRFIPNHGRQHARDSNLTSNDLQALRNTHDLLSVLYAASPCGFRPNIDLIRNLVNFSNAHTEVCKLNVRAWSNLVRFQLAEQGDIADQEPFVTWYNNMICQLLQQYRQARSEAQAQLDRSATEGKQLSKTLVEATISRNQAQVGGIIIMALATLYDVVKHAKETVRVLSMVRQLSLSQVLNLHGSEDTRVNNVLIAALEVYEIAYKRETQPDEVRGDVIVRHDSKEDSQDFGDFPDLDDMDDIMITTTTTTTTNEEHDDTSMIMPIQQLLSNTFGTESNVDDRLLTKLVDVWAMACALLVSKQKRGWTHFLDPQSSASWNQLRDTSSKRKYFAYFMTSIVVTAPDELRANPQPIISAWLIALLERESLLKYQARLTTALLNTWPEHPLLANLPFVKNRTSSQYVITPAELSQRRQSLISSILSNMRSSLEASSVHLTSTSQQLRHEYQDMLKQMMAAMRKNYQEIQQGSTTKGSYVHFVQRVIESLQQYTSDMCPIDRFFTDSTAFPLPDSDPTYVVGRLKSYGLKAGDAGEQKKLAIFFQAVCERAAVDNQQSYLIEQLGKAVEGSHEDGANPTLRDLLFRGIFPAYIDAAFTTTCGWILAVPVLEALTHMLVHLYSCFSLSDSHSLEAVLCMTAGILASLRTAFGQLVDDESAMRAPQFLATVSLSYSVVKAAASLIDYIHRFSHTAGKAVEHIKFFQAYGEYLVQRLQRHSDDDELAHFGGRATIEEGYDTHLNGINTFCTEELAKTLRNSWSKLGEKYHVIRAGMTREVLLEVGSFEDESQGVIAAIEGCLEATGRMPSFAEQRRWRSLEVRLRQPAVYP